MIKIKNIEIYNFKVFQNKFDSIQGIENASVILFNGPNGYGKTSIFDAIEFALTGSIKRIANYCKELQVSKTETYDKMILVSDERKEAWIKITMVSEKDEVEITCKYVPEITKAKKAVKDFNPNLVFDKFERAIRVNGEVVIGENEIQKQLNKYCLNNLLNYFDKCCFLSQDEHLSFLKEAGKNKVNSLGFLFTMEEETNEKTRINTLLDKLKNSNTKNNLGYLQILSNEKQNLSQQISEVSSIISQETSAKDIEYPGKIFSKKNLYWDNETMELGVADYTNAKNLIDDLMYFAENKDECIKYINSKQYVDLLIPFSEVDNINFESNKLEYAFRYYPVILRKDEIEEKKRLHDRFLKIYEELESKKIKLIDYDFLHENSLLTGIVKEEITDKIEQIKNIETRQNTVSTVISNISKTRTVLVKQMKEAINNEHIVDNVCIVCGSRFDSTIDMLKGIEEQERVLKNLCDSATKEISTIVDKIYEDYLIQLKENVKIKIQELVIDDLYYILEKVKTNEAKILNIKQLLGMKGVNLPTEYFIEKDILKEKYEEFLNIIESKIERISMEVQQKLEIKDFINKYEHFYDKNMETFMSISASDINRKKQYIEVQYFNHNMKKIGELKTKLSQTEKRYNMLQKKYDEIKKYYDAIEKGITRFKKKVLEDIEPLLFVYTAKILQQKFNGRSIMLWYDKDLKEIRFINTVNDKQDILYSMSSGQLAAVSISFLLCMNQVYSKDRLPILMLDDPLQTIDDVNMVGLVDILRYEFEDSQIFISTHETKFELFLRYKYEKTGKTIMPYNMKNLLLN